MCVKRNIQFENILEIDPIFPGNCFHQTQISCSCSMINMLISRYSCISILVTTLVIKRLLIFFAMWATCFCIVCKKKNIQFVNIWEIDPIFFGLQLFFMISGFSELSQKKLWIRFLGSHFLAKRNIYMLLWKYLGNRSNLCRQLLHRLWWGVWRWRWRRWKLNILWRRK